MSSIAERQRRRRSRIKAMETPEEAAARRTIEAQRVRQYRQMLQAIETPKQTAVRRAQAAARARKRRAQSALSNNPEDVTIHRFKKTQQIQRYRQKKRAMETPEQAEARRFQAAEQKRRRRAFLAMETQEQRAIRLLQRAEQCKQFCMDSRETPKQAFWRKIKQMKESQLTIRSLELETKHGFQTAEQLGRFHMSAADNPPLEQNSEEISVIKNEILDDNADEELPVHQNSEGISVVKTEDPEFTRQNFEGIVESYLPKEKFQDDRDSESLENRSQSLDSEDRCQYNYSNYGSLETHKESARERRKSHNESSLLQDAVHCMKMLLEASVKRDEHLVYGEYIAHKFRVCKRPKSEIDVAKWHVENVIFNLRTGLYSHTGSADLNVIGLEQKPASSFQSVAQNIIVKAEP